MIKGFALIPKKAGISDEQFHKHWEEVHAPLARQIRAPALRAVPPDARVGTGIRRAPL